MQRIQFVCLARSHKFQNLCIAGKRYTSEGLIGSWFRPIDPALSDAISTHDFTYGIGDIVSVNIARPAPQNPQSENYIISRIPNWDIKENSKKVLPNLADFLDNPEDIWGYDNLNNYRFSSSYGENDRCPVEYLDTFNINNSLYFIKVKNCSLIKIQKHNGDKTMAQFIYKSKTYRLNETYGIFSKQEFVNMKYDTEYKLGPCYLTISLSMPKTYDNINKYCYKLVAGYVKA